MRGRSLFGSLTGKLSNSDSSTKAAAASTNHYYTPVHSVAPPMRRPIQPVANAFTTSNDAPPVYTATPNAQTAPRSTVSDAADDPYSFLSTFDTIFLIDDSGSMAGRSWRECSVALQSISPICTAHDFDGIDIFFLNAKPQPFHKNVTLASTVQEIFSAVKPSGATPTGKRLREILRPYLKELERNLEGTKPINVIVVTDGVPTDDPESVLIEAAKKLDALEALPWQVGVQFMQVGSEKGAREHLEALDDELSDMGGGCRDIVDTVPMSQGGTLTGDQILKTVLGAVNKRLDRKANPA